MIAATLLITACGTTTKYEYVKPRCEPVPRADIQPLEKGEMKDDQVGIIYSNTRKLINNVKANEAIIRQICDPLNSE